ncbi:MAG: 2-oxoacid:ferredoxin oxidoreductase subunit beta, partial [Promethearchaeota archaeon]
WQGPSTPGGSFENPFNAISLLIEAGATFVARCFSGKLDHLTEVLVQSIQHKGFSFIEILQPAVPYHSWEEYREKVEFLDETPETQEEAFLTAKSKSKYTLGIFYRIKKPIFHEELYGNWNPVRNRISREKRFQLLKRFLT